MRGLDEIKQRALQGRVVREVGDLAGQGWAGTLFGSVLCALVNAVAIGAAAIGAGHALHRLLPPAPCAAACFAAPLPNAACCPWDPANLARAALTAAVIAGGSLLSTCVVREKRFQHSALTTALLLVLSLARQCGLAFPWWYGVLSLLVVIVAMFAGYRTAAAYCPQRS